MTVRSGLQGLGIVGFCTLMLVAYGRSGGIRPASQTTRLLVTGSSTVAPLLSEIAARYEATHDGVLIDVQSGGSSKGIADVRSGLADIGMASRELRPEDDPLYAHPVARDGVCIIVNAKNPVATLSDADVVNIFTGRRTQWNGPGHPITVVSKAEGRATLEVFLKHYHLASEDIDADVIVGDNEHGIRSVAADPRAIGYVSVGAAEYASRNGTPIRLCASAGVEASVANLVNGRFPIARALNLVTDAEPSDAVRAFVRYAQSAAVHDLVRAHFFVPHAPALSGPHVVAR